MEKAFSVIVDKVEAALQPAGYKKETRLPEDAAGCIAYFPGEATAYGIFYDDVKQRIELKTCDLEESGKPGSWKSVSLWLFDTQTDGVNEAQSIADDFAETIQGPKRTAIAKAKKKRKKDDDGNIDPLFFFNRFAGVFPDLKNDIAEEKNTYGDVRAVTFARAALLPKLQELCTGAGEKERVKRCCDLFNDLYANGDMDVRSIITIVILNGLDPEAVDRLFVPDFSDDLAKGYHAAAKLRGKKFKPEKKKKRKSFMASTLNEMNR